MAYHSGFRKSEILALVWDMIDFREGTITLPGNVTKNKTPRVLQMNSELLAEMKALHSQRHLGCPYVFHRDVQPVLDFGETWKKVCAEIGLQGKIFHDFRRTAVRNMVRAGIPEKVAVGGNAVAMGGIAPTNGGNLVATDVSGGTKKVAQMAKVLDFKGGAREGI